MLLTRNVVGVLMRVAGPAWSSVRVTNAKLQELPAFGTADVTIHVINDGRRLVKPSLSVTLTPSAGVATTLHRQLDTVLPGDSIDFPFAWPRALPSGRYRIHVAVGAPGAEFRGYDGDASLGSALRASTANMAPAMPKAAHRKQAPPAALGILIAGSLIAVELGLLHTTRRRRLALDSPTSP